MKRYLKSKDKENYSIQSPQQHSKKSKSQKYKLNKILEDLSRTSSLLLQLKSIRDQKQKKTVHALQDLEHHTHRFIQCLLKQNQSLRIRLNDSKSMSYGCTPNKQSSQSMSIISQGISEASDIRAQRVCLTVQFECPSDLLKFFPKGNKCRYLMQSHDQHLKAISLGLFKFLSVSKDYKRLNIIKSLIELKQIAFDVYQLSTIPQRYHYLYNNLILKAAILSFSKAIQKINSDKEFMQFIQENPVYQFLSMLFIKVLSQFTQNSSQTPVKLSFFQQVQNDVILNSVASIFELKISGDNNKFYKMFDGNKSWSMYLGQQRIIIFDVEENDMVITEHSQESLQL